MKRVVVLLALVVTFGVGRPAAGDPLTEHFASLVTELDARVAALDPPPNRLGRRQRRAAVRALNQIARVSETLTRDILTAKRVEAKLRGPFRGDETIDGLVGDLVANMRAAVFARISLLDDVATFDTRNSKLQNIGFDAVGKATTIVTRADRIARRPRKLNLLLRASRVVSTAEARLQAGPLARDLSGLYLGSYDLTQEVDECVYFHFGDANIRLTHTGKGATVTGTATLTEFEVLDEECFYVRSRNRRGPVTATFDGTNLTGTLALEGLTLDFTGTVDGDSLEAEFTSAGIGTLSVSRD